MLPRGLGSHGRRYRNPEALIERLSDPWNVVEVNGSIWESP